MYSLNKTWSLRGAAVAVAIAVALGAMILHYRSRDSAVAVGHVEQLQKDAHEIKDTLRAADHRTVTITDTVHRRITVYDSLRKSVVITDTSKFVLVDTQYVHVADSVVRACSDLTISCAQYRAAASKLILNQDQQIAQYKIELKHQPGKLQRIMDVAAGIAGGYGACKLTN